MNGRNDGNSHYGLSVIIPVYNPSEAFDACIKSIHEAVIVCRDAGNPVEVIVVDDCSTCEFGNSVQKYGFQYQRLPERSGAGAARNRGARSASGEVYVFIDADVIIPKTSLMDVMTRFSSDRDLWALSARSAATNSSSGFLDRYKAIFVHGIFVRTPKSVCYLWTSFAAVRAEVFRSIGGFPTRYRYAGWEDVELGLRIAEKGGTLLNCGKIEVEHRHHYSCASLIRSDLRRTSDFTQLLLKRRYTIKRLRERGQFLLYHEKLAVPFSLLFWLSSALLLTVSWIGSSPPIRMLFSTSSGLFLILLVLSHRSSLRLSFKTHGLLFAIGYLGFSSVLSVFHGLAAIHGAVRYGIRTAFGKG